MPGLVEVPERVEAAVAAPRARTEEALRQAAPRRAATEEQRERRAGYLARHWPGLDVVPEGHVGRDDTLWSSFLTRGGKSARAVARIVWKDRPAEDRWQGTGFLISDDVLLTNHHVLDSPEAA